jgi:hypothetical protein
VLDALVVAYGNRKEASPGRRTLVLANVRPSYWADPSIGVPICVVESPAPLYVDPAVFPLPEVWYVVMRCDARCDARRDVECGMCGTCGFGG